MAYTEPTEDSSSIAFERHFNPLLKYDSDYHKNLEAMLSCVEKNISATGDEQKTVCAKEYKNLRLSAFKNQLMYHFVNKRFFMDVNLKK